MTNKKCIFILLIILGFILRIDVYSSNKKISRSNRHNKTTTQKQKLLTKHKK